MTTEKPDIRVFCYRCWRDYMNAGMNYIPIYSKYKQNCEICDYHEGYEYIEVVKKRVDR